MKKNFVRLIAQVATVSALFVIGLIAISGEPAEDANFIEIFAIQIATTAVSWTAAYLLNRKWQIFRKLEHTGLFQ